MIQQITSQEYIDFCTPITASCIKDGMPMAAFWRGKELKGFGCGHCGLSLSVNNNHNRDLPLNL